MTLRVSDSSEPANKTAISAAILIGYVMIVLDISVVLTGLPKIQRDLGFSAADLAWVQSAYTLTFGGFLLLGARAGDILGRRLMFTVGLALFTLASLAIGLSFSASWMLAWRAIQDIGAAVLAPSTLALLQTKLAEGPERTRASSFTARRPAWPRRSGWWSVACWRTGCHGAWASSSTCRSASA